MKKIYVLLIACLTIFSSCANLEKLKKKAVPYAIPEIPLVFASEIPMQNNANIKFYQGDTCFGRIDAKLYPIGTYGAYILAIIIQPDEPVGGLSCPYGSYVLVPAKHFSQMKKAYTFRLRENAVYNDKFFQKLKEKFKLKQIAP